MLRRALVACLLVLTACSTADDAADDGGAAEVATTDPDSAVGTPTTADEVGTTSTHDEQRSTTTDTVARPSVDVDEERCLTHGNRQRCYLLRIPGGVDGPLPLVLDIHGYTGDHFGQRATSGFSDLAEEEGFAVAWPEGYEESFNAGVCCGLAVSESVDDVGFLRAIVEDVASTQDIDVDALFLTGLSNGCAMAQRAASEASDLFDGVACNALYLLSEPDPAYRPIPILEIHGVLDPVIPYEEGRFGLIDLVGVDTGAVTNIEQWATLNDCAVEPVREQFDGYEVLEFLDCAAPTRLVTLPGHGHALLQAAVTELDLARYQWEFLTTS